MEKYIDDQGLADLQATGLATASDLKPVKLSIDLRVQHIVRDEITQAMSATGRSRRAASFSTPRPAKSSAWPRCRISIPTIPITRYDKDRLNRMSGGIYEMGSTFKTFTIAMALDSGTRAPDRRIRRVTADPLSAASPSMTSMPRAALLTRAGNLHLFLQYRRGEGSREDRHSRAQGFPAPIWDC